MSRIIGEAQLPPQDMVDDPYVSIRKSEYERLLRVDAACAKAIEEEKVYAAMDERRSSWLYKIIDEPTAVEVAPNQFHVIRGPARETKEKP